MKLYDAVTKLGMKKAAALASGALVLGALGVATIAGAQNGPPPAPGADKAPGDCPKAQGQDNLDRRGPRMDNERQAFRRGGDEFGREGRQRPQRGAYGPGPDGNGPPPRNDGREKGYRQGPPPRGEYSPGPEGFGPPPRRDGDWDGFRQGPPSRREGGQGDFRQGPPPRGEFGQQPDGNGPRRPMGPPSFEDMDSNGDGSITKDEFDAFHESHRPGPPPGMRDNRPPMPGGRGDGPGAPAAPPEPPAPPAE